MSFRSLAVTLAAVSLLITGCTAESVPAATTPVVTPVPTPTSQPPEAKVPFGGECAHVLTSEATAHIFGGSEPTVGGRTRINGVMPDTSGSLAQLGGLACNWSSTESEIGYLGVVVVPAAEVPATIVAAHDDFGCYGWNICGRGEVRTGMWALVETPRLDEMTETPSDAEAQILEAAIDAAIGSVFQSPSEYAGVPVTPAPDSWDLPACEVLEPAAASASGMISPEQGFPGDNVPEGPAWETLVAAGIAQWCPWYEYSDQGSHITELQLQSGIGAPSEDQLASAGAEPIMIVGADAAYRLVQNHEGGARSVEVLAIVGPNRLLVGGDEQEAVAAAVLSELAR